ncbi:polysaccharide deacetylase family protein [Rhizobium sp. CRIBSB]|nr:polysaccharide deacetylase family protein [Rhizobium sp. CRIBSB]
MIRTLLTALAVLTLLAPHALAQAPVPGRTVTVTFDDLPYQAPDSVLCDPAVAMRLTEDFVAMLRPLDTHGVAFVNEGKVCEAQRAALLPLLLAVWLDAGLELGNHTFNHAGLNTVPVEQWLAEVDLGAEVTRPLLAARGQTLRWFRHPYLQTGETTEKKAAAARELAERGYTVAPVTLSNDDWMFAALYGRAEAAGDTALQSRIGEAYVAYMVQVLDHWEPYSAELTGGREPAQVLLLHANTLNRDWYPQIHALYLSRGYRFIPLEETLRDPVYALPDTWIRNNGATWLHRWTATAGRPVRWEPEPPTWITEAYAAL